MKVNIPFVEMLWALIKSIFWKNPNIIYINSNKKKFDKSNIDSKIEIANKKWVICQTDSKLGKKFKKHHLRKMKFCLFQILRNCSESTEIVYSGYVSPMFAIYDGYCLGDSRNYTFVDTLKTKNVSYKIKYRKKFSNSQIKFDNEKEINMIVSSSFRIIPEKCKKCKTYEYEKIINDKIDNKYLNNVYSWVKTFLDLATNLSIKRINLYVSARQPVSFVIGTAIQSYHPSIFVYEFDQGEYTDSLLIQEGKIYEVVK